MAKKSAARKRKDTPEILFFDWKESAASVIDGLTPILKKLGVVVEQYDLGTDDYVFSFGSRKATLKEVKKTFCGEDYDPKEDSDEVSVSEIPASSGRFWVWNGLRHVGPFTREEAEKVAAKLKANRVREGEAA
jgi:hypothetical protein